LAGVCLAAGLALGIACGGCASDNSRPQTTEPTRPIADTQPQITIVSSNREVAVGDTTTFTMNSKNTLGRNARVEWTTTGGTLTTEDNGRIARVQFDQPGAYTVTSKLIVDDQIQDQDAITVTARPLAAPAHPGRRMDTQQRQQQQQQQPQQR